MVNLVSFNCRSVRKNIHVVNSLCKKYEVIALQETFLPQQESDFLNNIHPNFTYVASSPVDLSQGILRGRPYGGLAFIFHENIASSIKVVPTGDDRILCIDINCYGSDIRIINCYMPFYDGSNNEVYLHLLGKINCVFKEHSNNHVSGLGDFNAHINSELIWALKSPNANT